MCSAPVWVGLARLRHVGDGKVGNWARSTEVGLREARTEMWPYLVRTHERDVQSGPKILGCSGPEHVGAWLLCMAMCLLVRIAMGAD
jgi:hypothetical protein